MNSKNNPVIFVVDDDAYFNGLISAMVKRIAENLEIPVDIHSFGSGEECMDHLRLNPAVILLDFYLDARNDITATAYDLLHDIHHEVPEAFILIISRQEDWSLFKDDLISSGADDFLRKDRDLEENLRIILEEKLK